MTDVRVQSPNEELANAITHGLGAALGVAGLVLLVVFTSLDGDPWRIVATSIYGASVVLLFVASTLYHWFTGPRVKRVFQIIDHAAIFLLIAGTYTPFTLVTLRGPWGWSLFGVVWGIAVLGVVFESVWLGRFPRLSVALYLAMGWVGAIAAVPMWRALSGPGIAWLVAGGFAYTAGVVFFAWEKLPYHHTLWHVFVLAGAVCHFLAVWAAVL
jgi:hemolysin III